MTKLEDRLKYFIDHLENEHVAFEINDANMVTERDLFTPYFEDGQVNTDIDYSGIEDLGEEIVKDDEVDYAVHTGTIDVYLKTMEVIASVMAIVYDDIQTKPAIREYAKALYLEYGGVLLGFAKLYFGRCLMNGPADEAKRRIDNVKGVLRGIKSDLVIENAVMVVNSLQTNGKYTKYENMALGKREKDARAILAKAKHYAAKTLMQANEYAMEDFRTWKSYKTFVAYGTSLNEYLLKMRNSGSQPPGAVDELSASMEDMDLSRCLKCGKYKSKG